jgi:CheY-like chemotaxis protein
VSAAPNPEKTPARGMRVLVVDDNVDAAKSLAKMVEFIGHEALVAHAGREAVEVASRERPDVLLLDIGLPQLSGYEVCHSLRASGVTDTLIVAVTGYGQDSDRQLAADAGFDMHLVKPVSLRAIQELLTKHAAK